MKQVIISMMKLNDFISYLSSEISNLIHHLLPPMARYAHETKLSYNGHSTFESCREKACFLSLQNQRADQLRSCETKGAE